MGFPTELEGVPYGSQGHYLLFAIKVSQFSQQMSTESQKWSVYNFFQNIFRLVKYLLIPDTKVNRTLAASSV